MEQLSLFQNDFGGQEIIIPKTMLSPLESKHKVHTKKFRVEQTQFSELVCAIQRYYKCSFFEARKMFFEYRDEQKPIMVKF